MIAATDRNGVIGRDGRIPWRVPADQARFRRKTWGCAVIMGFRTARSLDGRTIIVPDRGQRGVYTAMREAEAAPGERIWIAGGADTYRQFMQVTKEIDLTVLDIEVDGDTFMPEIDPKTWKVVERKPGPGRADAGITSTVIRYGRY